MTEPLSEMNDDFVRLLLTTVLHSVPDAMVVIDESGCILAFSLTAEAMFGYKASDLIGKNVSVLMDGHDRSHHDRYISNYLDTGQKQIIGIGRVVTAKLADGRTIPVELKIGEARLGERRLFTGYIRDVSEQKETEHRISQMQSELSSFSRLSAVGTMASAMAHELNQPLTAVANYLEAARDLLQTPDAETVAMVREALQAASLQSVRAGQIIRRLRDYVSRGEIETRPVDVRPLIADAVSLSKIGLKGPVAQIIDGTDDNLPLIMADRLQIRQVILNLVKNAMEAVANEAQPQIRVSARRTSEDEVMVEIKDNGPGLPELEGRTPFDPFYSSKPTGMGLGLSICHTIVDAHGGRIWLENDGPGATFRFTLKVAPPEMTHV